jgi:hypothetical protein
MIGILCQGLILELHLGQVEGGYDSDIFLVFSDFEFISNRSQHSSLNSCSNILGVRRITTFKKLPTKRLIKKVKG